MMVFRLILYTSLEQVAFFHNCTNFCTWVVIIVEEVRACDEDLVISKLELHCMGLFGKIIY
jgi:hypothetical protein